MSRIDLHHFFYPKKDWTKGYAKLLRDHWYCKVYLTRSSHDTLHARLARMPVPDGKACKVVYYAIVQLEHEGRLHRTDSVAERIRLLKALFRLSDSEMTTALDRQHIILQNIYQGM